MKLKLVAVTIILLLATGCFIQQQDDKLLPELQALIETATPPESSAAYTYLMGLHSPATIDPAKAGQGLIEQTKKYEKVYANYPAAILGPWASSNLKQELPAPSGPLFCHFSEPQCLPSLFKKTETLNSVIQQHNVLLERWETFKSLNDLSILSLPTRAEPFPPYSYMFKANRLSILQSIVLAQTGNTDKALEILLNNTDHLRKLLTQDNHLVGKMILVQLLSDQVDTINALIIRNEREPVAIAPLSLAEKSLEYTIARELAGTTRLNQQVAAHPEVLQDISGLPSWAAPFLFKPKLTTNALFPTYLDSITSSELSPADFATHVERTPVPAPKPYNFRNPIGTILNNAASINIRVYVGRIHDLDVKIHLFNALHNRDDSSFNEAANKFTNPYFPDDLITEQLIQNSAICLKGPLANTRRIRCLQGFL